MKLYCETRGEKPFDWNAELDALIAGKAISHKESDSLFILSSQWTTCACGNQCDILPRRGLNERYPGEPRDPELFALGSEFNDYIEGEEWAEAKECLRKIEARSAFLISQLNEK